MVENKSLQYTHSTYLLSIAPKSILKIQCRDDYNSYVYSYSSSALELCALLKYGHNTRHTLLSDITCADFLGNSIRFMVITNIYSLQYARRVVVSMLADSFSGVASFEGLFPCATWFQREAYEMYGISFRGSTDNRRLLTDYGYMWHPLRKDFPLSGYTECYFDDAYKCVVENDVNLIHYSREWASDPQ
jgi:NADH:ubiquinone oxidoreductase subunit C